MGGSKGHGEVILADLPASDTVSPMSLFLRNTVLHHFGGAFKKLLFYRLSTRDMGLKT